MANAVLNIPVTVVMERKQVSRGKWSVPHWRAVGVAAGGRLASSEADGTPVSSGDDDDRFVWGGIPLELHSDWAESYRFNLIGENPSLYVICSPAEDDGLRPLMVTANFDEASAHLEGNDQVFPTSIPPDIYKQMERFVVEYYVPKPMRKRKRKNWSESRDR